MTTATLDRADLAVVAPPVTPAQPPRYGEFPDQFSVEVTPEDIRMGTRSSGNWCPVAWAIRRELEGRFAIWDLDVEDTVASINPGSGYGYVRFDHDAQQWINAFDHGMHVEPCTVVLRRRVLP